MKEFVSQCDVFIDGQQIQMQNFREHPRSLRKHVKIMKGGGTCKVTTQHLFAIDYPKPTGIPFDFENWPGGTVTVQEEDGERFVFEEARVLDAGEKTIDDENPAVLTIEFFAERRK